MCLSDVYRFSDEDRELLLENVMSVQKKSDGLTFSTVFGEEKTFRGSIKEIDFKKNIILIED